MRCPKCGGGWLIPEHDQFGDSITCGYCSWSSDTIIPADIRATVEMMREDGTMRIRLREPRLSSHQR